MAVIEDINCTRCFDCKSRDRMLSNELYWRVVRQKSYFYSPVQNKVCRNCLQLRAKKRKHNDESFKIIVREAFSQRRKTIRNGLKNYLNEDEIEKIGIPLNERAENLHIKDFVKLSNLYYQLQNN